MVPASDVPRVHSGPGFWPHYQAGWMCPCTRFPKTQLAAEAPSCPVWVGVGGCGWVCPSGRPINHPWAERTNKGKALRPGRAAVLGGEVWGGAGGGRREGRTVHSELRQRCRKWGALQAVPALCPGRRGQGLTPEHLAHVVCFTPLCPLGVLSPLSMPPPCPVHVCRCVFHCIIYTFNVYNIYIPL